MVTWAVGCGQGPAGAALYFLGRSRHNWSIRAIHTASRGNQYLGSSTGDRCLRVLAHVVPVVLSH